MRIARVLFCSLRGGLPGPCQQHLRSLRFLSTGNGFDGQPPNSNSFESTDDFERTIFGGYSGDQPKVQFFYQKLDRLERLRDHSGFPSGNGNKSTMYGLDESFNTLSDGMDGKLKKAATYFEFDPEEIKKDDYAFRPDVSFQSGMTYDIKVSSCKPEAYTVKNYYNLDLKRLGVCKPARNITFNATTEEVSRKADFRTGISAKAQRKVAREITTARAFGLMPFKTMGTKSFVFGKPMVMRIMHTRLLIVACQLMYTKKILLEAKARAKF